MSKCLASVQGDHPAWAMSAARSWIWCFSPWVESDFFLFKQTILKKCLTDHRLFAEKQPEISFPQAVLLNLHLFYSIDSFLTKNAPLFPVSCLWPIKTWRSCWWGSRTSSWAAWKKTRSTSARQSWGRHCHGWEWTNLPTCQTITAGSPCRREWRERGEREWFQMQKWIRTWGNYTGLLQRMKAT